jgi:hypothetical protein
MYVHFRVSKAIVAVAGAEICANVSCLQIGVEASCEASDKTGRDIVVILASCVCQRWRI